MEVLAFAAMQPWLFHLLGRLDRLLEQQAAQQKVENFQICDILRKKQGAAR